MPYTSAGAGVLAFQFHTGSIKRTRTDDKIVSDPGFNSILVRLKAEPVFRNRLQSMFQFHTGSIKSEYGKRNGKASLKKVSIPYWFD